MSCWFQYVKIGFDLYSENKTIHLIFENAQMKDVQFHTSIKYILRSIKHKTN